jgi:hypothetical protein
MIFRHFLYINESIVRDFLAQAEGGRYVEEQQRERGDKSRRAGAKVGAHGLGAEVGAGSIAESERSRVVHQTPASEFQRLVDALTERAALQYLDGFDDQIWQQLRRGEIIEVEAEVSRSPLGQIMGAAAQIQPLMDLMGNDPDDAETKEAMEGLAKINGMGGGNVGVLAHAAGAPEFKFIATLDAPSIAGNLDELDGECTMVAKIMRKLRPDETYSWMESLPIFSGMPREMKRQAMKEMSKDAGPDGIDMLVRAPAAVVTPIALYR